MKKLLCYALAFVMLLQPMATKAAEDITAGVNGTIIDASVADYGTVTIPKNIVIDGSAGTTTIEYKVSAAGSIAGDHVLNVTMPDELTLSQNGKDDVVCAIDDSNPIKYFVDEEYNGSISDIDENAPRLNGTDSLVYTIHVDDLSAGPWKGVLEITISIEDKIP